MSDKVSTVIPVHDLPSATRVVRRKSGRPRNVEMMPTIDDLTYHAEMVRQRESFVDTHPMVLASAIPAHSASNSTVNVMYHTKHQIAREIAVLEFSRMEMEKRGVDSSMVSGRIIAAYKQLSDTEINISRVRAVSLDPNSEEIQKMFRAWVGALQAVTTDMIKNKLMAPEVSELLFSKFAQQLEGWETSLEQQ